MRKRGKALVMSEAQHTALAMIHDAKQIKFDHAMTFSMRTLWSLLERGHVSFSRSSDSIKLTPEGLATLSNFRNSDRLEVSQLTAADATRYEKARKAIGKRGLHVAYRRQVA